MQHLSALNNTKIFIHVLNFLVGLDSGDVYTRTLLKKTNQNLPFNREKAVADPEICKGGFYLRAQLARLRKVINIHCYVKITDVTADTYVRTSTQNIG